MRHSWGLQWAEPPVYPQQLGEGAEQPHNLLCTLKLGDKWSSPPPRPSGTQTRGSLQPRSPWQGVPHAQLSLRVCVAQTPSPRQLSWAGIPPALAFT